MTELDFYYLTPILIVSIAPVVIMITIAWVRNYKIIYSFSILSFAVALASNLMISIREFSAPTAVIHRISTLFTFDGYTFILSSVVILSALVVTYLSRGYLLYQESEKEEYFIILFVAVLGSLLLLASSNFITLFLGIETLSISLYILVSYRRSRHKSLEAGVKYLVLASVASAFLLFGMGLIYTQTGNLDFSEIRNLSISAFRNPIFLTGFAMMMVGLGFKLALAPFHLWTPDVYEGAPVPVTTFISTISKGSVIAVVLRFFYSVEGFNNQNLITIITLLAILSMFFGNILAIRQQNIKRILAFSSIANMGYLIVTLLIGGQQGISSAIFYIITYFIALLGAFGVITLLSDKDFEAEMLTDYRGLFWKQPLIAIVLTLCMLSLAGIPLTAGFMGKFYLIYAGVSSGLWLLMIVLVINSVIALYYYLRIVTTMFTTSAESPQLTTISTTGNIVLSLIAIAIMWLGIFPQQIIRIISLFSNLG